MRQLDQPFDIGHGTIRATFEHMIWNHEFWSRLMEGELISEEPEETGRVIAALSDDFERRFQAFAELARRLRDEGRLEDTFVDHWDVRKSMGGTILAVTQHDAEHRTEIVHMLHRLGLTEVPEVDLGAWDYEMLNT